MMWYGDTLQGMVQEIMDEMDDFEYGNAYVIVEGFVDMLMEENNFEGYFSDVVSHTIQMIDLHEIAEHCMEK